MTQPVTLGQAIDSVLSVLEKLDDKSRETVLTAACSHLGMQPPHRSQIPSASFTVPGEVPLPGGAVGALDIRTLKSQKQPRSPRQMACLVAYYLQEVAPEAERKAVITGTDLEKYFKQAGFKLPSRPGQVLIDAKADGYFESAGRGEYRLNAVGYNLVAHNMSTRSE